MMRRSVRRRLARACAAATLCTAGLACSAGTALPASAPAATTTATETFAYGHFGATRLLRPVGQAHAVALVLSGDQGWNDALQALAAPLRDAGIAVVGIDSRRFVAGSGMAATAAPNAMDAMDATSCVNVAFELEQLAHAVQLRLHQPAYVLPHVIGVQSGANLAYIAAVQAPRGTFAGAVGLGFVPTTPLRRTPCALGGLRSHALPGGGRTVDPVQPGTPWVALHDVPGRAAAPGVLNVLRTFAARARVAPPPREVADLPLVEVPATAATPTGAAASPALRDTFAVLWTGDGGWAGLDRDLADGLAAAGVPVVALDTLRYFWRPQPPVRMGADLQRMLAHYARRFGRPRALLVGYSYGADTLPFALARLPANERARVRGVALVALGARTHFEFHLADWITDRHVDDVATVPAVDAIRDLPVLCVYGEGERESGCPALRNAATRSVQLPGGHHFDGDYGALVRRVLAMLEAGPR